MQRFRKFMYNWVDHRMIFKHSNGISRPTVFEVRMRQIDLAVDHTMAVVFCAPKHNRICFMMHDRIRQYFYNFPDYLMKFLFNHQDLEFAGTLSFIPIEEQAHTIYMNDS